MDTEVLKNQGEQTNENPMTTLANEKSFEEHMREVETGHNPSRSQSFSENREIAMDRGQHIVEARALAGKTEKISDLSYDEQKKFYLDLRKQLKESGKTENEINEYLEEFSYSQQTGGKIRKSEDFIPPEFPSDFNSHGAEILENDASKETEKINVSPENNYGDNHSNTE